MNIFYDEFQEIKQPALIYIGISNHPLWIKFNIVINSIFEIYPNISFYIADINFFILKKYSLNSVPALLFKYNDKLSHYNGDISYKDMVKFIQNELNVVLPESELLIKPQVINE